VKLCAVPLNGWLEAVNCNVGGRSYMIFSVVYVCGWEDFWGQVSTCENVIGQSVRDRVLGATCGSTSKYNSRLYLRAIYLCGWNCLCGDFVI